MERTAFAYLRVSGLGQVDGDGFPRQLAAIQRHAQANGVRIIKVFREEGVSGTSEMANREALQAMLAEIADSNVNVVYIERLERLARDLMIQETIIGDLRKRGIELVSTTEPDLCSDDPSRKLMRQIFGAIAEYDRAMTVLKLRGARERMRAKSGACEGRKRYGTQSHETPVVERICTLHRQGLPITHIANALNAAGIAPRAGKQWYGSSVRNILMREGHLNASV